MRAFKIIRKCMSDAIVFLGVTTNLLELISFLLAVITVALTIRQIHWGWLFSIVSSGLYAAVFFDAKLYGDMGLQGMFILVSICGLLLLLWVSCEDELFYLVSLCLRQDIFFMLLCGGLFAALVVF